MLCKMLRLLTTCVALAAAKTSPYSFSLSTFSPEGRIQQIEFAGKAVDNGPPCAAITTRDGVVLAKAYKKSDKALVVHDQSLHILRVTESTIATYAGLPADFRALVDAARTIAIELEKTNGFPPSASMLATEVGRRVHAADVVRVARLEMHLFPATNALYLYLLHGYRQYGNYAMQKIVDVFSDICTVKLYKIGGPRTDNHHLRYITIPYFLSDQVHSKEDKPDEYARLIKEAIPLDMQDNVDDHTFWALETHYEPKK